MKTDLDQMSFVTPYLEGCGGESGDQHVSAEDEVIAAAPGALQCGEPVFAGLGRRAQDGSQELEAAPRRHKLGRGLRGRSWKRVRTSVKQKLKDTFSKGMRAGWQEEARAKPWETPGISKALELDICGTVIVPP